MSTETKEVKPSDLQKAAMDLTSDSKSSSEGQTTIWPERELPELLRDLSEEELKSLEKKLIRKVDLRMLPTMILIYIMNYLDRNAIGSARLGGLEKDLGLTGNEFQGVLCACSGATHSFGGLVATRFFLGFVEAAFYPGCLATLSSWYIRKELGVRTGLFYSGSMLSGAFSGLIAAGITNGMDGARGLLAWRWLFIIEGSLTVAIALGAFFVLPDFPANTKWLTDQERQLAMWRMEVDAAGEEDWTSSSSQPIFEGFKMILVDPINWILVVLVYGAASSISINSFFPTVVASLGKDRITTLLLTSPPYLLACIVCAAVSWNADRMNERYWHTVAPLACSLVGFIISSAATGIGPRYFGAMIMLPGIYTGFNMSMVWTANTIYRPTAKRAAAVAFNNAFSTLSGIYGSYLYPNNATPRFVLAFSVNAAMALMAIVAATVLHFVLKRENKKLEMREQEAEAAGQAQLIGKGFRYLI
ncbi:TNA1 is necessary for nicotinic acid import into the cell [Colletotrichum costaricense]|uniref:TNA1 is necessary for nicotinic acid import into the cell n=1 Tax=Colletotrichum costaricense TaxID=1209916 RepID=A0AAJ0E155_9PEZI|nr:TNA1 is necessary for nicotinic acid import into the cell [Colletotrichum costaricense]KAK1527057.1 TNA1 is necessary for nicotinic acid import into the cell [Colletotrichum costaricense]